MWRSSAPWSDASAFAKTVMTSIIRLATRRPPKPTVTGTLPSIARRSDDPSLPPMLWRCGEDVEPPLLLVLPSQFGRNGTLNALADAVQWARNECAEHARRWATECDRAQATGDHLRQAMWHGMTMAWSSAVHVIDEALCEKFDLFGQSETWDPPSQDVTLAIAERIGLDPPRPEFPLPELDGALADLLARLQAQRQDMIAVAVAERSNAHDYLEEAQAAGTDVADCPYYQAHYNRAMTWAMAADRIDAELAVVFGRTTAYLQFLDRHGPWQAWIT